MLRQCLHLASYRPFGLQLGVGGRHSRHRHELLRAQPPPLGVAAAEEAFLCAAVVRARPFFEGRVIP